MSRISEFEWQPGITPLSSPLTAAACVLAYLMTVALLRSTVQKPTQLPTWIPAAHNLVLCIGSLVMFIGTAAESVKVLPDLGLCFAPASTIWPYRLSLRYSIPPNWLCRQQHAMVLSLGSSAFHQGRPSRWVHGSLPALLEVLRCNLDPFLYFRNHPPLICRARCTSGATCTTCQSTTSSLTRSCWLSR